MNLRDVRTLPVLIFVGALGLASLLCVRGASAGVTYSPALSGSALQENTTATVTDSASIGQKLTGTGSLTVTGTGTLTVDQWQGFTGGLIINSGATVAFNATKPSGTTDSIVKNSITVNVGGTLRNQANSTMSYGNDTPALNINGGTVISESSAGGTFIAKALTFTNGGTMSDSRKDLTGWGGNIALDGNVVVSSGSATITAPRVVLSTRYQVNPNVPVYTCQFSIAEGASLTINGVLQNVEENGSSVPTNPRSIHKSGKGTLVLNGAATYRGQTKLINGTIKLGVDNALPVTSRTTFGYEDKTTPANSTTGNLDLNGHNQTLVLENYMQTTAPVIYPRGSIYNNQSALSTVTLNIASSPTIATTNLEIKGNTKLVVDGGGTLQVNTAQLFTGGTVIKNGKIQLSVGGATVGSYKNGGLLNSITIEKDGTLELTAGGTMGYDRSGNNGMPTITINGGTLVNNCETHNLLYNLTLSNDALIQDLGTGKTGWAGNFGLEGTVTVTSGTGNMIQAEKIVLAARYAPSPGKTSISISDGAALILDGNLLNSTQNISTDRAVTKSGAGLLTLAGTANTYKGATTVSEGELRLDSGSLADAISLATSGISVSSGANLTLASPLKLTNSSALVQLSSADALSFDFTLEDLEAIGGTVTFVDDLNKIKVGSATITAAQLQAAIPSELQYYVKFDSTGGFSVSINPNAVPEPATWTLLLVGLIGVLVVRRKK